MNQFSVIFSDRVSAILNLCIEEAKRLGYSKVEVVHLMIAILRNGDNMAVKIMQDLNIDILKLKDLLEETIEVNNSIVDKSDDDKIRILRRISFVIYSCKKDTFSKQFDLIQSKAKDLLS